MKLIIDIPEEEYAKIKESAKHNAMYLDLYLLMQRAAIDGIPLDKIRAEIMKLQTYKMFGGEDTVYVEHEDVLAIIDKYRAESGR